VVSQLGKSGHGPEQGQSGWGPGSVSFDSVGEGHFAAWFGDAGVAQPSAQNGVGSLAEQRRNRCRGGLPRREDQALCDALGAGLREGTRRSEVGQRRGHPEQLPPTAVDGVSREGPELAVSQVDVLTGEDGSAVEPRQAGGQLVRGAARVRLELLLEPFSELIAVAEVRKVRRGLPVLQGRPGIQVARQLI